jgi:hypothetical protein
MKNVIQGAAWLCLIPWVIATQVEKNRETEMMTEVLKELSYCETMSTRLNSVFVNCIEKLEHYPEIKNWKNTHGVKLLIQSNQL